MAPSISMGQRCVVQENGECTEALNSCFGSGMVCFTRMLFFPFLFAKKGKNRLDNYLLGGTFVLLVNLI